MKFKIMALVAICLSSALANNVNTGGLSGINKTYSAYSIGRGSFDLGLSIKGEFGEKALDEKLAGNALKAHDVFLYTQVASLGFGITDWMDFAIDMPFYQDQISGFGDKAVGFGDLAASVKVMHPGMRSDALIRLAYIMRVSFPTGDPARGYYARDPQYSHVSKVNNDGAFTSRGYSLNPMLAWTFDLTRIKDPQPWLIHVNFGMDALIYHLDNDNIPEENTAMVGGLAVEWLAKPNWSIFLDFYGKSRIYNVIAGPFLDIFARDKIHLALGTKNAFASGLHTLLSVEAGLSTQENHTQWNVNHEGAGNKIYGIQPTPVLGATLTIGFGKTGKKADSDFDGNPNLSDKCPQDGEDYDGYQDEDGCPDPIHIVLTEPAVTDTVLIVKRDTVTVVRNDTIRVVVTDTLQYQAKQDPNQIFGFGKTTFPAINFKSGSDELTRSSFSTLNDIAGSMKNFPGVDIQVIGYTDNTGTIEGNKLLSTLRANAVVTYLVRQGVPASRLVAEGKGIENPVATNNTANGRLLNRRVEFRRIK